jgi:ribosomal-protein-alanine N-acetyltransferase
VRRRGEEQAENPNYWAAVSKENGKMIGNIYFHHSEPAKFMTWELGYIFNPNYRGKGYATEAARRVVQHGFEDLKAHRIVANCNPENAASWKLMERLGMRREKHAKSDIFFRYGADGKPLWQDSYQYAMLAGEFSNSQ